jgi:DUF438 domain-containing protein
MNDFQCMYDGLPVAVVAVDADMKITYANPKGVENFRKWVDRWGTLIGRRLEECHNPESMDKIRAMFESFRKGDRSPRHYVRKRDDVTRTIVHIPFSEGDEFRGVIEMIFECALD